MLNHEKTRDFFDMYAPIGLTKNNTYDIENNTQEEADDDEESRIDTEKDVAENNNREIAVDDERDV